MKIIFHIKLMLVNKIFSGTRFFKIKKSLLESSNVIIGENSKIVGPIYINSMNKLDIGKNCWIGKDFTIDGNGAVYIGNNCDLAPNVRIATGSHEIGNSYRRAGKGKKFNCQIDNGVWIGTNSLILNGSNIGAGSVVAAGAVVVKDVLPNIMVAGNPAIIKKDLKNV